jgi:hypothetical protein
MLELNIEKFRIGLEQAMILDKMEVIHRLRWGSWPSKWQSMLTPLSPLLFFGDDHVEMLHSFFQICRFYEERIGFGDIRS